MEIVTECFVKNSDALADSLLRSNYTLDQVYRFLPAAALAIIDSTRVTSLYETMACLLSGKFVYKDSSIDINAISRKTGMGLFEVATGLKAITPVLLPACAQKSGYQLHTGTNARSDSRPLAKPARMI